MARIAGVDLPPNKRLWIGLTAIYGIGQARARSLAAKADVDPTKKIKDLTEEETTRLRAAIESEGRVEGDLRKEIQMNVRRLIEIQCYRGLRHRRNLPVRGQRTHTNARTRKGPRKGAVAAKQETMARKLHRRRKEKRRDTSVAKEPKDAAAAPEGAGAKSSKWKKEFRKNKEKRIVPHGVVSIQATFNNTIITLTDPDGRAVSWSSAGSVGFKGSRKGTPYAAQQAGGKAAGGGRGQNGMKTG